MTIAKRTDEKITLDGHAGNKIVCAMVSSLCVSTKKYIEDILEEKNHFDLKSGKFIINMAGFSAPALLLVESFWYGIKGISHDYPDNIKVYGM